MIKLLFCHMIGDYVLQSDFIAKTKGSNLYHLFVHCVLYCLPFYILYGVNVKLFIIFITHVVIDILKAKYNKINYATDQIIHYIVIGVVYLL